MKKVNTFWISIMLLSLILNIFQVSAQKYEYHDSWGKTGFNLQESRANGVKVIYSINEFSLNDQLINGETLKTIHIPGHFLPNNAGAPDLPGDGRYIAVPQGAKAVLNVNMLKKEIFENVEIAPAFLIPIDSDRSQLVYEKNMVIYGKNEFYPANPIIISESTKIRGVDVVMLGITPFQYNPVTKELIVYRDIDVDILFEGGNGHIGENRLRSRWFDPLLRDMLLNQDMLPEVEYPDTRAGSRLTGCEYIIISPNDQVFQNWADSIRAWRNLQGILTEVFTLNDIGGNSAGIIENFIDDAYNNWQIPPVACLLLADYGSNADNTIISPIYNSTCASDHIFADVNYNHQADIIFARITAQHADHLSTMVGKMLSYERNPPTNPNYYAHPITAMGWQTSRWFQICSETINGFWTNVQFKQPVRENAIYSGTPGGAWSTAQNTEVVVNYFGPNGLGYIPATSSYLTDWGGDATRLNNDMNSGAFMLQHRDHGNETGWGEPDYHISDMSGLYNQDYLHVFSIECLTGKFNWSGECFAEAFHRHQYGALSVTAASEISYSFVNDTYVWGIYDNMWTDFMPDYGTTPPSRDVLPAFGNAAGKYFLEQSDWPYNTGSKEVTYYLFHHHGGAFSTVYSEMPEDLTVIHDGFLIPNMDYYTVQANEGAFICILVDDEIIGTGTANGAPKNISITPQTPGTSAEIVITLQNFYRFHETIIPAGPPNPPQEPYPYNASDNVVPYTHYTWENGFGSFSESYKIYIGTDNPPSNIVNGEEITGLMFTMPEHLEHSTTYYWRVDAYNQFGSAIGEVWSFTTKYPPDENYETGDFSGNMWSFEGDLAWVIDDNVAFDGNFSARSGPIGDNQSSSMFLSLNVEAGFNTVISFWKMVSSDPKDKLQFYMDGELKDEWGGLSAFSEAAFETPTGYHTFEWRYVKDSVNSYGDDCVWVDYIYFPPLFPATANAGNDTTICEGSPYTCQGFVTNCVSLLWETSGSGTFDDNTIMCPAYTPGPEDILAGYVTLTINGYTKAEDIVTDDMTLSFDPLPAVPETPVGPEYVDIFYTTTSEYTTSGGLFADEYIWSLTPEYAGTIEWNETTATVTWDVTFLGSAFVSVMGVNECGDGPFSDELEVTVDNTVGFGSVSNGDLTIRVLPNPNNGSFKLEINNSNNENVTIRIFNAASDLVFEQENVQVSGKYTELISLHDQADGVYLVQVEGKENSIIRKIIIQK
ncbi:MAG: T9SS type A sorting domain-containing protein [Bacteroidales bacterium]|nr:T9SS type A sorting domain-containing protein [Bacteroidales bacterium]